MRGIYLHSKKFLGLLTPTILCTHPGVDPPCNQLQVATCLCL